MTKTIAILIAATLLAPAATASTIAAKGFVNGAGDITTVEKRKKPRIKGGSGCDDAHDRIEHPECR